MCFEFGKVYLQASTSFQVSAEIDEQYISKCTGAAYEVETKLAR